MSFKREGDDASQLNILKKRRVADLLANFIPEDEAALMSNGRYTCLVCSYRPVFDTVDMLTVHRNGNKHLEGLKSFYGRKTRLKNEIAKRQHEKYVQLEDRSQEPSSSAPLLEQTRRLTHHALLKTVPYNSCHRNTSTKSEKGPGSVAAGLRDDASSKTSSDRENTCWKSEAPSTAELQPTPDKEESRLPVRSEAEPRTAQRSRELQHYLKLKSDGWLKDRSGQWIKDENVEFDSDEEEPPSLARPPTSHGEN